MHDLYLVWTLEDDVKVVSISVCLEAHVHTLISIDVNRAMIDPYLYE